MRECHATDQRSRLPAGADLDKGCLGDRGGSEPSDPLLDTAGDDRARTAEAAIDSDGIGVEVDSSVGQSSAECVSEVAKGSHDVLVVSIGAKLVITGGSLTGTTMNLTDQQITIGRAHDSTIVLDDDYASSRHARIYPAPDGTWIVEDLGSTNGTYLDRTRLTGPTPVPLGAPIRIGKTVIELRR